MDLSKLTIVTPSYERDRLLIRNIKFWDKYKVNHIVLDGSSLPNKYLCDLKDYSFLKYIHDPIPYHQRIATITKHVKTPYLILVADDDLCFPSVLAKSIEFLELNPDYSACSGRAIGFSVNSNKKVFPVFPVYEDMYNDYIIDDELPLQRVHSHMSRYMPSTMYAVQRTKNWKFIIGHYLKNEHPIFAINELNIEILTAFCGKSIVLNDLGWLKSTEEDQISVDEPTFNQNIHLDMLWRKDSLDKDLKDKFLESMTSYISEETSLDFYKVQKSLDSTLTSYSNWVSNYFRQKIPFYETRDKIKSIIPLFIREPLLNYYRRFKMFVSTPSRRINFLEFVSGLQSKGWQVNMSEAIYIDKHIRKSIS
ncbi:hypothetical protein CL656_05115 [bacterium]|nr:hypothetical protein [bacterium]|tara:strand:- start:3605 stop:4699 length:1095 start_codon:yes stop_codon:yes gene_type:complete